ncbi:hypothetical protein QBC38DRAFT_71032 [Podospora fimiseda]|uniref:Apple domain-containing protein n=1 Tax=Podospora fimiseda TaxID=252190 RepID=A0AAN7H5U7_9PEZI|nr:hypothetical protein QBC38DRAFT_71032 [Podospora fimiseda]
MDVYRPSTRDSQRTVVPSHQAGDFPKDLRLSHTTSRAHSQVSSPYYSDEKSVVESPVLGHAALPGFKLNSPMPTSPRQGSYWTERDLDLPQYPGTPTNVPVTLEIPPIEDQSRFDDTICGIRRRLFLRLLGIGGIILLAIAIGVGVGVGLGQKYSKQDVMQSSVTSNGSEISTPTTTSGIILPTTTQTSTAPSATVTGSCPGMDNTQYRSSTGKNFLHLCGVDYSGKSEAIDIGNATTATFKECVELCSNETRCTGVGWGARMDDSLSKKPNCWMKSGLNQSHTAKPHWNFAVLLAGDD